MIQRTALITGGTRGIGRAIALKLLHLGYNVAVTYVSDDDAAHAMIQECQILSSHFLIDKVDVTNRTRMRAFIQRCQETFFSIDALVNNAGLNRDKPLHQLTEEDWDLVVDTHMKGTFICSQLASSYMLQQEQGGCILNVSATTAIQGRTNGLNYCAAKAGVLAMTKCLALELAPKIRVNCLIPGFTWTDETNERFHLHQAENVQNMEKTIPLKRIGTPEEVANIAVFLLSDAAGYINGQKIIVDGGQFML